MSGQVRAIAGHHLYVCAQTGPCLADEAALADVIGAIFSAGVTMAVLPLSRLGPDFLDLSTGVAGALLQKFITYRLRVAVIGDTSAAEAKSKPLRDFLFESNRGVSVWFCPDMASLQARLARRGGSDPSPQLQVWA